MLQANGHRVEGASWSCQVTRGRWGEYKESDDDLSRRGLALA